MKVEVINTAAGGSPVDCRVRPCPFCGSTKGADEQGETYRWRLWRCSDCGACGPETRCNITGSGQGGVKEARTLALAEWNRRDAAESERYAPLMQAVEWLLNDGHMNQEHLARLRSAWEGA